MRTALHRVLEILAFVCVLFVLTAGSFMVVNALAPGQTPTPLPILDVILKIVTSVSTMVGLGSLMGILIDIFKRIGWVTDGTAPTWMTGMTVLAIVVLVLLALFKPEWSLDVIDAQLGLVANVLIILFGFLGSVLGGFVTHFAFKVYAPAVGFSYSLRQAKAYSEMRRSPRPSI